MYEDPGRVRIRRDPRGLQSRGGNLPSLRQVMSGTGGDGTFKAIF